MHLALFPLLPPLNQTIKTMDYPKSDTKITKRANGRLRVQFQNIAKSMTVQSLANETNINTIVARIAKTGIMPQNPLERAAQFGDFTRITNFHDAQNVIANAQSEFAQLPAKIRAEFENDPAKMIAFLEDDKNLDKAVEMGLASPRPVVQIEPKPDKPETKPETKPDVKPSKSTEPTG